MGGAGRQSASASCWPLLMNMYEDGDGGELGWQALLFLFVAIFAELIWPPQAVSICGGWIETSGVAMAVVVRSPEEPQCRWPRPSAAKWVGTLPRSGWPLTAENCPLSTSQAGRQSGPEVWNPAPARFLCLLLSLRKWVDVKKGPSFRASLFHRGADG